MNLSELESTALHLFDSVRELCEDGVGITRASYGSGETAAINFLCDFARRNELMVSTDAAANVIFSLPEASDAPGVWVGSHLDSVPQGGNFDGLAGVVAGLLCLLRQHRSSGNIAAPLRVIGFRGEESAWFGKAYIGSAAMLGMLAPEDMHLRQRGTDRTLAECMSAVGADVKTINLHRPLVELDQVCAYLELHIEQGPVMVARALPLAVVTGIRGNVRHQKITCVGEAGHSGTVPRWLRRDAMFAVADLIVRLDEHWRVLLERGTDLVVTTGICSTDPADHSMSRIPGRVSFSFEARSRSSDTLEEFYKLMKSECSAIASRRQVDFEFDRRQVSAPAQMDSLICSILKEACQSRGVAHDLIPSGAGHDASLFANAGIPAGMLFIRNQNGSHNPAEGMEISDFMLGVQVLEDAVRLLSSNECSGLEPKS